VRLSLNESADGCSPLVRQVLQRNLDMLNRYSEGDAQVLGAVPGGVGYASEWLPAVLAVNSFTPRPDSPI
jgi:hypothetical protein